MTPCPTCKGRCCRTAGFSTVHDPPFWSVPPTHVCPDCHDGTCEVYGHSERASIVAYLLIGTADCRECMDAAVVRLAREIERGDHLGASHE